MERVAADLKACLSVIAVASLLRSACFLVSTSSFIFSASTHHSNYTQASTAHVRRASFLADVQLVCKCFSNGTEALPGGCHLQVLSVEQSTANATETVVLVRFDVAPTVYIRTGVKVIIRRCYLIAIAARPSLPSSPQGRLLGWSSEPD